MERMLSSLPAPVPVRRVHLHAVEARRHRPPRGAHVILDEARQLVLFERPRRLVRSELAARRIGR